MNLISNRKIISGDFCPSISLSTYLSTNLSLFTPSCPSILHTKMIYWHLNCNTNASHPLLFESRSAWAACWIQSTESMAWLILTTLHTQVVPNLSVTSLESLYFVCIWETAKAFYLSYGINCQNCILPLRTKISKSQAVWGKQSHLWLSLFSFDSSTQSWSRWPDYGSAFYMKYKPPFIHPFMRHFYTNYVQLFL